MTGRIGIRQSSGGRVPLERITAIEAAPGRSWQKREARGRAVALVQGLTVKFGPLPETVSRAVRAAPGDQVQAWTARAVTAETLDQVFS